MVSQGSVYEGIETSTDSGEEAEVNQKLVALLERLEKRDSAVIESQAATELGGKMRVTVQATQPAGVASIRIASDFDELLAHLPEIRGQVQEAARLKLAYERALAGAWEIHAASEMPREAVGAKVREWFSGPEDEA